MTERKSRKSVAVTDENYTYLTKLAADLTHELGHEVSIVAANAYAINFVRSHRLQETQ